MDEMQGKKGQAGHEPPHGEGVVNPLSMPLEKGMEMQEEAPQGPLKANPAPKTESETHALQPASGKKHEEPKHEPPHPPKGEAHQHEKTALPVAPYRGPGLGIILVVLFLFPFFFNLGSELYLLARTAIMAQMGSRSSAPAQEGSALKSSSAIQPLKSDSDKIIDSLALVIANQEKLMGDGAQRVLIIHPDYAGTFSYDAEKQKIEQLAGIDLDTPLAGTDKMGKIRSAEILSLVIESLDRVLLNAAQYDLSEFHVKNALEAKKQALKRLQEIR